MAKTETTRPAERVERRFVPTEDCELRVEAGEAGPGKTAGYIALYDQWSPVYFQGTPYAFRERIAPGFFDEAIARDDIRHLKNHDKNLVLGRNKAGTVSYLSDERGLWHEGTLPDTSYARDLAVSMRRGDITGASFAFMLPGDGSGEQIRRGQDGVMERTLLKAARVPDTSVVTYPFYTETEVAVRHVREFVDGEEAPEPPAVEEPEEAEESPPKFDVTLARAALRMGSPYEGADRETRAERRYSRVTRAICATPWAIHEDYLGVIMEIADRRSRGEDFTRDEKDARMAAAARTREVAEPVGGVAIIPVTGVIMHRAAMLENVSGPRGTSTELLSSDLREAIEDPDVSAIVLDIDSPGGNVHGVEELGDEIQALRGEKPIVAVSNAMAASAAYWIGTQADSLVVTPSGEVGSVGVYAMHADFSGYLAKEGVSVTYIQAGPHKTEGAPEFPLSDDAREHMQSVVDEYYDSFVRAVARGRKASLKSVRESFGGGRLMPARRAVALGMADRVGTLRETVAQLQKKGKR